MVTVLGRMLKSVRSKSEGRDSNPRKIGLQPIAVAAVPPPQCFSIAIALASAISYDIELDI